MSSFAADLYRLAGEGGRIGRIAVESPPGNLITRELSLFLRQLPEDIDLGTPDVRAVVLSGLPSGPFCGGTDESLIAESRGLSGGALNELLDSYRVASAIAVIQRPVIAAVEGDALEQGLELALAADLRVAGENATFRMAQVHEGLIPWDGGTQRLSRVVGASAALEIILTGRVIDAEEALELGLVNRVVPTGTALDAAMELAESIAKGGPIAARYAKEAVHTGMDLTLEQGVLLETDLTMVLQTTADRTEGINSFLERREPTYRGE